MINFVLLNLFSREARAVPKKVYKKTLCLVQKNKYLLDRFFENCAD